MPEGVSHSFATDGSNSNKSFQTWLGVNGDPFTRRSWSVRVRSDPANGANIKVGRGTAVEVVLPGDSVSFDFARLVNLYLNDLGTAGLLIYVDDSGPLDPGDLGMPPGPFTTVPVSAKTPQG
ncbi:MAG: hypothetical protein L3K18_09710 [Thermoplasmata archaeon]|nr:hypothetical protein [Thermoplasmata archaeon]